MAIYGSDQHTSDESCVVSIPYEPVKIKDKWKVFAIRNCFSNETTDTEALSMFIELTMMDDREDIEKYFKGHNEVIRWSPFEHMDDSEFVEQIEALAHYAQEVENTHD